MADRELAWREGHLIGVPLAAGELVECGHMVTLADGYAREVASGEAVFGLAAEAADNSEGEAGDKSVLVQRGYDFLLDNDESTPVAQGDVGKNAYATSSASVSASGSGESIGVITGLDEQSGRVFVHIG